MGMETNKLKNLILILGLLITCVACKVDMQAQMTNASVQPNVTNGTDNNPIIDEINNSTEDTPVEPEIIYNDQGYIKDVEVLNYLTQEVVQPVLIDLSELEEMQFTIQNLEYNLENCVRKTNTYKESNGSNTEEFEISGTSCDINYYESLNQELNSSGKTLKTYSQLEVLNSELTETSKLKSAVHQERLDLLNPDEGSSVFKIENRISSLNLVLSDGSELYFISEYSDNGIIGMGKISVRSQELLVKGITIKGSVESYIVDENGTVENYYFLNGDQVEEFQYRVAFPASLP